MAIDLQYVPLFTIEEVILDKDTALPLAAGVVSFYRDSQRATPKSVYQISGTSPNYTFTDVGSVLTLGISGTFVDGSGDPFVPYAYPYDNTGTETDLYYVTVESSGSVDQFVREAVPYLAGTSIPSNQRSSTENELSNPQFVEILFPSSGPKVFDVSGTNTVTPIAPDWAIVSSGTGTLTIERLQPTAASIPTNPSYILSIAASSGLGSQVTLRQRLTNTPSIMRGGFASGSLIAAVLSGGGSNISMTYAPSLGSSPTTVIPSTSIVADGSYHSIANNAAIPQQANDPAATGYIDINITIPTSRTIGISSIQLVGTEISLDIPYDEQTTARQKDHLFHYYEDSIINQPKNSILTGWNFGLNPWQFASQSPTTITNVCQYITDQTILSQKNAAASSLSVSSAGFSQRGSLKLQALTASNIFAIIQYIDPKTINPYWALNLSSMVTVFFNTSAPNVNTTPGIKMRLIYRASLPSTIGAAEPITSWDSDNNPVFAAGWTAIIPENDPTYTPTTDGTDISFPFNKFVLPRSTNANMTLAVVVYTTKNMDNTINDYIEFERISLVQNDFAIDCNPQTFDEVLRECQFYYEKSYDYTILPGTINSGNIIVQDQISNSGGTIALLSGVARNIFLPFKATKRSNTQTITLYDPQTGLNACVHGIVKSDAVNVTDAQIALGDHWISANIGSDMHLWTPTNTSNIVPALGVGAGAPVFPEVYITFHYTIDCRLGI